MLAQVFGSPATIGFFLGLAIGTLYLINQLFLIEAGSSLLTRIQKWFKSRPILLPSLLFLVLPFIFSFTFESISNFYTQKDLSESRSTLPGKIVNPVIGPIVGGFIGFISSYLTWRRGLKHESRNVAYAIYQELVVIEQRLKTIVEQLNTNPPLLMMPVEPPIPEELYNNEEGLFFVFRKESSQFRKELSNSIFEFYMNLNEAEKFRKQMEDEIQINKILKETEKSITIERTKQILQKRELGKKLRKRKTLSQKISEPQKEDAKRRGVTGFLYLRVVQHLNAANNILPRLKELLKEEFS